MKILLVCAGGSSTSFLASNMRKAAQKRKLDAEIAAYSFVQLSDHIAGTDLVMIAPQAMFGEKEVRAVCEPAHVKYVAMDSLAYRMLNGEKLLNDALDKIQH